MPNPLGPQNSNNSAFLSRSERATRPWGCMDAERDAPAPRNETILHGISIPRGAGALRSASMHPTAILNMQLDDVLIMQDVIALHGLSVEDPRAPEASRFEVLDEIAMD